MTDANKNLLVRIASALAVLPAVLALLWWGPVPAAALTSFAALVLAFEYYRITLKTLDAAVILGMLAAAAQPLAFALWPDRFAGGLMVGTSGLLLATFTFYLLRGPLPEAPTRVAFVFTGIFYCGLLPTGIVALRRLGTDLEGLYWVLLALTVTWINDTGAYAAGRTLGRHKLYPAVSPGKTWEGFFGGVVASVGGAFLIKALFLPQLTAVDCVAIALPCAVLGPLGDLSESMLKRAYGVKDSGKIMPGHGGLLDRLDALLFNLPYIWLYTYLTRG